MISGVDGLSGDYNFEVSRGRLGSALVVLGGITLIGVIDFLSGVELRVFPLYYAPITLAAWSFGRSGAVVAGLLSALGWLAANHFAGLHFSHPAIWVANTVMQAASFMVVGLLVASLHLALSRERALSRMDPLCSMLNVRAFHDEGTRLLALCRRGKRPITLAYLDVDDFKTINDGLGHAAGDDVLRAIAAALQSCVRSSDLTARIGGDEFAILLTELAPPEARQALERVRAAVTERLPRAATVSVSIGAVTFAAPPDDLQAAIHLADHVMYEAKKAGKNRIHLRES
jgi:diguanylate cyclase (GGDEF)-like protein